MTQLTRLLLGLVLVLVLTGCDALGNQTTRDLEGVPITDPFAVQVYASPDEFPNLMLVCPEQDGPAYLITTREYHDPQRAFETCPLDAR